MLAPEVTRSLKEIVGPENLYLALEDRLCYAYDASNLLYLPEAVVFPEEAEQVAAILRLANRWRFPVVPRGAGTGTTGGALPIHGGVVLVTTRMNRILEIDPDNFLAVVEPGVITGRLQAEAAKYGLYYPPDPSSANFCTIGGNVAENAGGRAAVKYGVTRDYVLGLTAVLPTGEIIDTGTCTAKGVVGYDLTRLLVGSEGTLGIITKIILRLVPLPAARRTALAGFRELAAAARAVSRIRQARLDPSALEFLDQPTLECIRALLPLALPPEVTAVLLLEVDGHPQDVTERTAAMVDFCHRQGAALVLVAESAAEREQLWQARKLISPASFKLKPHKLSEDVVVPVTAIPELVAEVAAISRETALPILCFGHAGDGNIHINIMYDQAEPRERAAAQAAVTAIFTLVRKLRGTLSGEHGVGITKAPYLHLELSPTVIELSRRLKRLFDPHNILNPGKVFSPQVPAPLQMPQEVSR